MASSRCLYYLSGAAGVVEIPAGGGAPVTYPLPQGYWQALAVDSLGNFYLVQQSSSTGLEIERGGPPPALCFATTNIGSVSSDSPRSVQVSNIGNQPLTISGEAVSANFAQVFGAGSLPDRIGSLSLAAGAGCNLAISFDPTAGGLLTGAAKVIDTP